jgi:hypothetical protein
MRPITLNLPPEHPAFPSYEALSYVWGDETFPQPILVNGRFLAVRRNLHNALYHLRHPRESGRRRTLWVDALCINQSNLHERNHQISLMRNIFSNARQVIAWLGEADLDCGGDMESESDLAMDFLASDVWTKTPTTTGTGTWTRPDPSRRGAPGAAPSATVILALAGLFSRPYWTRVWIVQEVAMARKVTLHCGDRQVPWERLVQFMPHTRIIPSLNPTAVARETGSRAPDIWRAFGRPRKLVRLSKLKKQNPVDVLREAADFEASVPVDKVYGLLGLFPAPVQQRLVVDYAKTLNEVVGEVMRVYLKETMDSERGYDLSFLSVFPPFAETEFESREAGAPGHPSWLPDVRNLVKGMSEWYDPSKGHEWSRRISFDYPELHVPGVLIGVVEAVLGPVETRKSSLVANHARWGRLLQSSSFQELKNLAMERIRERRRGEMGHNFDLAFFHMVAGLRIFAHAQETRTFTKVASKAMPQNFTGLACSKTDDKGPT